MNLTSREQIEQRERATLAPYAAFSGDSKGRVYQQDEHPLRTPFQRDRDRIVHSAAFRRMEYKTQVFIPHEKDHFRTRLTHTIEVAQISRTLARALNLNEDLAEAIALAHDLGHTPFGHAGERVLNVLLEAHGGFNHNRQSLRIVEVLEERYPEHPGLNLSYEVREGIAKHETSVKVVSAEFAAQNQPTLEAALVDIADEIAYNAHDVDDGVSSGILTIADLEQAPFYEELVGDGFSLESVGEGYRRYALARRLVNRVATDVLNETVRRIEAGGVSDLDAVRSSAAKLVGYSPRMRELVVSLKLLLKERLYDHPRLVAMSQRARGLIEAIFERLEMHPVQMPLRFQKMLEHEKKAIVIADYIAGMTDRYAEKIFDEVTGGGA